MILDALVQRVEQTYGVYTERQAVLADLEAEVTRMEEEQAVLALSEAALSTLLAEVSQENLRQIEGLIAYGLQMVFDDKVLGFKFVTTQQRGGPALEPVLVEDGHEMPILDAKGGGPANVVAFLLRLIVTHKLGLYPLLLLDESFSMVSAQYLPNLGKLLRELSTQLHTTILLVTHQPELLEHATHGYQIVADPAGGAKFEEVV